MDITPLKVIRLGLALLVLTSGCNDPAHRQEFIDADSETYLKAATLENQTATAKLYEEGEAPISEGRKLIRNGELSLRTSDLGTTVTRIREAVASYGGYIGDEERTDTDYSLSLRLQVRIPATSYDDLVERISNLDGKVEYFRSSARDVTEEYIDLEARLNSKRQLEERYLSLLKSSRSVDDILAIEKELNSNRSDIESLQGRLRYLNNQVAFSTLDIRCAQQVDAPGPSFGVQLSENLRKGWSYFTSFLLGITAAWPFILLVVAFFSWMVYRRRRARNRI